MRISDWSSDVCSSDLVGDADVADAGEDVAGHVAVAAGGLARQVVLDPAQPLLGVRGVVVGNHRREQAGVVRVLAGADARSEEHTSELQSLMRISYAVFCLKKKKKRMKNKPSATALR